MNRYVLAYLLLLGQTGGYARAGVAACNVCNTARVVTTYAPRSRPAAPAYAAAATGNYITYGAQYPVNYYVAPWAQAQAADTYHFRGSEERLELERLRGYVAAVQELTRNEVVDQPEEKAPPSFEQPAAATAQTAAAQPLPPRMEAATRPLVQFHCSRCPGQEKQSGGVWLDANAPLDGPDYDGLRGAVWRALNEGRMPRGPDGHGVPLQPQVIHDIMREISGAPTPPAEGV